MATKAKRPTAIEKLKRLGACDEAVKWCEGRSVAAAWRDCERGDWMLWLCGRMSGEPESDGRRKLVLCACACARLSLTHVPAGELRPLNAIETAEKWARGEAGVTMRHVLAAAAAATAYAAYAASADADSYNAAAAYAADAAYNAAYTAPASTTAAAYAAYAAAYASDAAYTAAAHLATLKRCAEIVRQYYPKCPLK